MTNTEPLVYYVRKRQPDFLRHIPHLPEEEPARRFENENQNIRIYTTPQGNSGKPDIYFILDTKSRTEYAYNVFKSSISGPAGDCAKDLLHGTFQLYQCFTPDHSILLSIQQR